jgi:hypothetical protein
MTLHTNTPWNISSKSNDLFSGTPETSICDIDGIGQAANAGCSVDAKSSLTFGAGFSSIGGGVYMMEWTSEAISLYFFPRTAIPADITRGTPTSGG